MAIYDKLILNNCHVKGLCGKNIRQYLGIITGCNIFADMRNLFVTIVFILPWYVAMAQEVNDLVSSGHDVDGIVADGTMLQNEQNASLHHGFYVPEPGLPTFHGDSLALPRFNMYGNPYINMYPTGWGGWYDWNLHKGLNVNIGASVFAMFGKGSHYKGAGFSQNISMMYAMPLTGKLSLALGGYFTNTSWSHDSYRDAGINAVLGYRFNEHWEAYLFGQKSLVNKRMPLPLYDANGLGDRIGAAVKYNFTPSFSIQVSVSTSQYDLPVYTDEGFPPMR